MIQSVILQKKRLGANHMKTFSWIPKDSNTGENKDSTINPLFFSVVIFYSQHNLKVFSHGGLKSSGDRKNQAHMYIYFGILHKSSLETDNTFAFY